MKFLLIVLKIYYVLDPKLPPIPTNSAPKPGKPMDEKKVSELKNQRKTIMEQVHELQVLVNKLKALSVPITEAFQVGAILTKLPPSWKSFSKKMLNKTEYYSLDDLLTFLRIEEEARTRDKQGKDVSNVYHVQGESSKKRVNRNNSQKAKLGVSKNNFKKSSPLKQS
ncbi:hypothetical protein Tco_1445895 [Tanacetum coccineum]